MRSWKSVLFVLGASALLFSFALLFGEIIKERRESETINLLEKYRVFEVIEQHPDSGMRRITVRVEDRTKHTFWLLPETCVKFEFKRERVCLNPLPQRFYVNGLTVRGAYFGRRITQISILHPPSH